MVYDVIFVTGELYFDHPLCGVAILKRLLEKNGYTVGVIEQPKSVTDVGRLGKARLFFGVTSGAIDSMVRNYTPLKKSRNEDPFSNYSEEVPDRATIVYTNWIKQKFKGVPIVLGGTEVSMRRFTHYDYWQNRVRKPILFDAKADLLVYGNAEKQILEVASRLKDGVDLAGIKGTCVIGNGVPKEFNELPAHDDVVKSGKHFCKMQNMFSVDKNLVQKVDNRYLLQYKSPKYTTKDLDEYYGLLFTRVIKHEHMKGFEFSVVTHRGCIGECNFCSIKHMQGNRIISRSETSILKEVRSFLKMPHFRGNIDDIGGPSANMYGMDCNKCDKSCLGCSVLDRSNGRLIALLRKIRGINGIKNVFVRSGVRYDLASPRYLAEVMGHHVSGTLKIAPEHVSKNVLRLMNKDVGFQEFLKRFKDKYSEKQLCYYFMVGHPGNAVEEARQLGLFMKGITNKKHVQIFTPTPMTVSTCMYHTGLDPKTGEKIYVPYTYSEKKEQKRMLDMESPSNLVS